MLPNAFDCPLEVEGRSLLLKIWHTYDTGLRLFKPDPPWKPPLDSLASIVLKHAMQPAKGGKQLTVSPSCDTCELQHQTCQDVLQSVLVALIAWQ